MKKLINCFVISCMLLFSTTVLAQELNDEIKPKITTLHKGEAAPFEGTLFNLAASADLLVKLKFQDKLFQIEKEREFKLLENTLALQIKLLKLDISSQANENTRRLELKDAKIDFYINQLDDVKPKWYDSPSLWFSAGVVVSSSIYILLATLVN